MNESAIAPQSPASESNGDAGASRTSKWAILLWTVVALLLMLIAFAQATASRFDHAVANLVTVLGGFLIWLLAPFASSQSRLPRALTLGIFLLPPLLLGAFFSIYRIERLDGELRPQFVSRWSSEEQQALPEELPTASTVDISPRDSDFPMFQGDGTATLSSVKLNTDWEKTPPEIVWQQDIGEGWSSFAVQGDVAVTMEQRGEEEWVSAYHLQNGELLWYHAIESRHTHFAGGLGPRSTPTIFENRVYACSAVDELVCLELTTGELIWSQDLLKLAGCSQEEFESAVSWGRAASPLVNDQQLVVPLGGEPDSEGLKTLIAFDPETGEELWRNGSDQISYCSPMLLKIGGVDQVVYTSEKQVGGYQVSDGKPLWAYEWTGESNGAATASQPIWITGNQLFISKGYGIGCALVEVAQDSNGQWGVEKVWDSARSLKTKFTTPVRSGGFVYGLSDGILECVDLSNGKRKWKKNRYRQGQVMLVGQTIVVSAESGELVLVAAKEDKCVELAKMQVIEGVTWNTPALAGDLLLMRNSDEVACVRLSLDSQSDTDESQAGLSED